MRKHTWRGTVSVTYIILISIGVALCIGIYRASVKKAERNAATEQAARTVEIERANNERKMLEQKLQAAKAADILQTTLKSFDDIYARWNDAAKVAALTSRIALAAPFAALQALRREADSMVAPDCLNTGKAKLLEGMQSEIDGFTAFMADANLGKYMAEASFSKSQENLKEFEAARAACPKPQL